MKKTDPNKKNYSQHVLKAGFHLLSLVTDVLDLAKIEANSINLSIEAIDIHPIIEECIIITKIMAKEKNITLTHSVPLGTGGLWPIICALNKLFLIYYLTPLNIIVRVD